SGKPISILEIANLLIKLLGKDLKPDITFKFRKGDVRHCYADISKIKSKIGFEPKTTLEDGLKKLIEWAKKTKAEDKFEKAHKELKKKGLV
ncbi:MAG: nucleoside-diphosphate sugar epimerase, partial [Candidatus Omnitrophica bacterium]|nr:nucleoside-diphosphate sugar epimerase [Candidatus Omnitrophota bacterium]